MDSRAAESEILELENKLLYPTAKPVSLPLGFLRWITNDFCNERELGRGGYGVVYKGILRCGLVIAVKKFGNILTADDQSFENEVSSLMDIKHHNVVQLLGFCTESRGAMMMKQPNGTFVVVEEQTRMLCFEYMCNGDLDKYLSDESSGLEWNTRYKIIKGICSGLKYLHECSIIHLDLKPQNILMDTTMMPKLADFGLSRLLGEQNSQTSNPLGTRGYMAPEYIDKGIISKKTDIFSLGVIIIQILTGSKDYPYYGQSNEVFQHFIKKVLSNWRNRFETTSKYTSLELHIQQVKQCIDIALECLHPNKEKRPNVSNIIEILNAAERSCCVQNGEVLLLDHQLQLSDNYLVYCPPGAGKSSLVAMALSFDLKDLELLMVCSNTNLQKLLIDMPNKSILVIDSSFFLNEVIDSSEGVASRERDDDGNGRAPEPDMDADYGSDGSPMAAYYGPRRGITLSGLVNCIDRLWSTCGEERCIVFTNYKHRLDPALLRLGRMDMHVKTHGVTRTFVKMDYCGREAVKTLARNYILVDDHPMFPDIQELLSAVDVTPAEVSEMLCAARDVALQLIVELLQKKRRRASNEIDNKKAGDDKEDVS